MTQEFWIETIPKGQARHRMAVIGGHARAYDPADSRDYKADIKYQILAKHPQMMEGPVTITFDFIMRRPQGHYGKKGLKQSSPMWCQTKPDLDNLEKAVMDAITSTGRIWKDDSQVCVKYGCKKYGEVPGIKITIQEAT